MGAVWIFTIIGLGIVVLAHLAPARFALQPPPVLQLDMRYRLESVDGGARAFGKRFDRSQVALLEKLNRADLEHIVRLGSIVVPETWLPDELAYSPLPTSYVWAAQFPKLLVVYQPGQVFGAYEYGCLIRWGPISSGRQTAPTPAGLFHLNWRSRGRHSTVDPEWFMEWYFNFENDLGLSFHQYALPGHPASHACVRLLGRDAEWLYQWGEEWQLDAGGRSVQRPGTPVLIVDKYDFRSPPPWRSLEWLARGIELPPMLGSRAPTFPAEVVLAHQRDRFEDGIFGQILPARRKLAELAPTPVAAPLEAARNPRGCWVRADRPGAPDR